LMLLRRRAFIPLTSVATIVEFADLTMDLRPGFRLRCEECLKFFDHTRLRGGKVFRFKRIVFVIVEFEVCRVWLCAGLFPFDETVAFGSDSAAKNRAVAPAVARKDVEDRVFVFARRVFQNRNQTLAFERSRIVRLGKAGELAESWIKIDRFDQGAGA